MNKKSKTKFPPGWNEARVQRVIKHYDKQSDAEAIAEDEARVRATAKTTMHIPSPLVPKVRALIAKHQQQRRKSA